MNYSSFSDILIKLLFYVIVPLILIGFISKAIYARKQIGNVIYKAKSKFYKYDLITFIFFIVVAIANLNNLRSSVIFSLFSFIIWLLLSFAWYVKRVTNIKITDKGILSNQGFILWENIKYYTWDVDKNYKEISFKLDRGKKKLLFSQEESVDKIDSILEKYIKKNN
ncbi:MAG: DUF5673 domain-containing protein [Halanaerobiales bacterium]